MKYFSLFLLLIFSVFANAQTNGQVIQINKGQWRLMIVTDSTLKPPLPINDTTWISEPDTILVWHVVIDSFNIRIHDTLTIVKNVHDTMWQCGTTNQNWCPTKPVVTPPPPPPSLVTIFTTQTEPTANQNDNSGGITVGFKWRTSQAGYIKGVRFYKVAGNTGVHTGILYSATGTVLATGTYSGETASGWQTLIFGTEVAVLAGTTYVAAEFNPAGNYSSTDNRMSIAVVNSPLTGLADGTDGSNGLYIYGTTAKFPINTCCKADYGIDVIYSNTK